MSPADRLSELVAGVGAVDAGAGDNARRRHEQLAKPPGSLGQLEGLGAQLAAIARVSPPPVPAAPVAVVAAGDHGIYAQGVTPWPQAVTAIMAEQIAAGAASAGAIARSVGAEVRVLDVGVIGELPDSPRRIDARVRAGTGDWTVEAAMTRDEATAAMLAGADAVAGLASGVSDDSNISRKIDTPAGGGGADLVVHGEMGLANTTTAAAIMAAITGRDPAELVGPGAGADAGVVARKAEVVAVGLDRHQPDADDPVGVLAAVGGLEHAALVGVTLAAASHRLPVVLDGVSSLAAAVLAVRLTPAVQGYLIAGHRSTEPAAPVALDILGLDPLLDLGMRLGEGSGGLLAVPLVCAAARVLGDVVTLDQLGF